jgi:hypothetical protein
LEFRGFSVEVHPSSDGTFVMTLPEGEYWFRVSDHENFDVKHPVKSFSAPGADLTTGSLTISDRDVEIKLVFEAPRR